MTGLFAGMSLIALVLLVVVGAFIYFVPSIIAWKRKHNQFIPILLINVFFGWSLIGWVGALVWSVMSLGYAGQKQES